MKLIPTPQPLAQALLRAMARGVLPSSLSSAVQRKMMEAAVRAAAVFSARTTNALYLQVLKDSVERALKAGYNNDRGMLRMELKETLRRLGYTPDRGFPGDARLGIPPAEPGSLRDISSDKRINFILDQQERLMRGAAQKARGEDRKGTFPAWELVRIFPRVVPRGTDASGTMGWPDRWLQAGGALIGDRRMVALKGDPIWAALGDSARFDDAMDVDHPPFAFNSGYGWREVDWMEAQALGLIAPDRARESDSGQSTNEGQSQASQSTGTTRGDQVIPEPRFNAGSMDTAFKAALVARLKGVKGKISTEDLGSMARDVRRSLANSLLGVLVAQDAETRRHGDTERRVKARALLKAFDHASERRAA